MQLQRSWKVAVVGLLGGILALVGVAGARVKADPDVTSGPPLILYADTVLGSAGLSNPKDACVLDNRFQPGQTVVWRIKVYDPATGSDMDSAALQSVQVTLPDGQVFSTQYGPHPGKPGATPTDYFWSAGWSIPQEYPTGSLPYRVDATGSDGRTGKFTEFNVFPSLLTIVGG